MLKGGVGGENRVVRLNDRGRHLGRRVHGELELGLLSVIGRETLHQQRTETGSRSTAEGVKDEEALKAGTVVGQSSDLLEDRVDELLADGVVTSGI